MKKRHSENVKQEEGLKGLSNKGIERKGLAEMLKACEELISMWVFIGISINVSDFLVLYT